MPRKAPKTAVVAFKVEKELADLLNQLPNKSAFIRKAIASHLGMACPLCQGKGVVPRGVHDHFVEVIKANDHHACDGCGNDMTVPLALEPTELAPDERSRLEQFLLGGPLYCDPCFEKAPSCDDCGWHIAPEVAADHYRKAHRD